MYKNILITTDGSVLARKAVAHGLELAKALGAKVTAVIVEAPFSVFDVPETPPRELAQAYAQHADFLKRHAGKALRDIAEAAAKDAVACETLQVESDQPYQAILKVAGDKHCDAIVMASHGRSGIKALVLGSVTNKVLTHATIPVVVVH